MNAIRIVASAISLVLLAMVAAAPAQSGDRFLLVEFTVTTGYVIEVDSAGRIIKIWAQIPTRNTLPDFVTMAEDNQSIYYVGYELFSSNGFIGRVTSQGSFTTIHHGPAPRRATGMVRTDEGDWIIPDLFAPGGVLGLFRLRGGQLTTLSNGPNGFRAPLGLVTDPESGNWVYPSSRGLFEVNRSSMAVTTFSTLSGIGGPQNVLYRAATRDWLTLEYSGSPRVVRVVEVQRGSARLFGSNSFPTPGPNPRNILHASGRVWPVAHYFYMQNGRFQQLTGVRADGSIGASVLLPGAHARSTAIVRLGSRALTWFPGASQRQRTLQVSVPTEAGRPYVVGFSATGIAPAIPLADGRSVALAVDGLTAASVAGGVPGVLTNTVGILDASGEARVGVDWRVFGGALAGMPIWAALVVLDPSASQGIAEIAGPIRLRLQ